MMKTIIRKSIARTLFPMTYLNQSLRPGIRILMYHRIVDLLEYDQLSVTPQKFEMQMKYLSSNYHVISLNEAMKKLNSEKKINNSIVITFDDGYLDNLKNALPILNKYSLPATIFVTTEFCEQRKRHQRYKSHKQRLHLNWDEVKELNQLSNITIGSHTLTHPYLSRIERKKCEKEIIKSKEIIEEKLNSKIKYFCYPSGDYGEREIDIIKKAGYEAAVSVAPGLNRCNVSPYEVYRTEITQKDSKNELALKLNGAFDPIHKLLHWRRKRNFQKMIFRDVS